jgi:hypothetical protein
MVSGIGRGETISTAFVESTINQVVSRSFVKRQQMHWTLRGTHPLLQTRTKVLNNELGGSVSPMVPILPSASESCVTTGFSAALPTVLVSGRL